VTKGDGQELGPGQATQAEYHAGEHGKGPAVVGDEKQRDPQQHEKVKRISLATSDVYAMWLG
jgi:hypothetical protein